MNYTTDIHSLVWYFSDEGRLSEKALNAFEDTIEEGIVIVPSIVLAEIMFIAKKGRISLGFEETLGKIEEQENFEVAALDSDVLKVADTIEADLEIPRYINLIRAGKMTLDGIITYEFGLDQINEAIDVVRSGDAGRVLIDMSE